MNRRPWSPSRAGRRRPALLLLGALAVAIAAGCQSEPPRPGSAEKGPQTAQLDLRPRKSSFRDIGKRGDSDLGGP